MSDIKVIDCGRDALQKVLSDHVNQGYEIVSVMFIEQHENPITSTKYTMFTVILKK